MKKISKREIKMIACVLAIGVLLLGYFYYYLPLTEKGETIKAELVQKTKEYEETSEKIEGQDKLKEKENVLIEEIKTSLKAYYPTIDIEEYIVKLNSFLNEAGIKLNSISFQKPKQAYVQLGEPVESGEGDENIDVTEDEEDKASSVSEGNDNIEGTEDEEDMVSSSEYGYSRGEFTISFSSDYNTTMKFMQILEQNPKAIVCYQLEIIPELLNDAAGNPLYLVTMSFAFLEVYGMDDYIESDNQTVLQDHPYKFATIKNPFERGG